MCMYCREDESDARTTQPCLSAVQDALVLLKQRPAPAAARGAPPAQ